MNRAVQVKKILLTLLITLTTFCLSSVQAFELEIRNNISEEEVLGALSEYPAVYFVGVKKLIIQDYVPINYRDDYDGRGRCGTYVFKMHTIELYKWESYTGVRGFPVGCLDHELGHHYEHYWLGRDYDFDENFATIYNPLKCLLGDV